MEDATLNIADFAAARHEENPNSRTQFDNTVSMSQSGWGGDHLLKGGIQFARLYFDDQYDVQNSMYLLYNNGRAAQVREYNTPTDALNVDKVFGLFLQDSWHAGSRLTINLGFRYDHNVGTLPANSTPGGLFVPAKSIPESSPIKQNIAVWRTGLVFDATGDGHTALKASYSRYGLQVGIDRVLNVNPLQNDFQTCTWTDPNNDRIAQLSEISQCGGYAGLTSHYASSTGPNWPYSDEVTAGVEREVMKNMRVGAMYYYRTNRNQIGVRNVAVPTSAYTPATVNVPNGPNGATTATVFVLSQSFFGLQDNVVDNQPYLDTKYQGVEFTANKRLSNHWQMVAGFTVGKNTGGLNNGGANSGQSATVDLNDPNNTLYSNGIVGNDSKTAFRLSGSYQAPWAILFAGSLISNTGFPIVSTYAVPRTSVPIATPRATQTVFLSQRGDERLPTVTLIDLRISRAFRFGPRSIVPQMDIYNLTNRYTPVGINTGVGGVYQQPSAFVAPRIIRIGFAVNF
jgi:hypothetical protein